MNASGKHNSQPRQQYRILWESIELSCNYAELLMPQAEDDNQVNLEIHLEAMIEQLWRCKLEAEIE